MSQSELCHTSVHRTHALGRDFILWWKLRFCRLHTWIEKITPMRRSFKCSPQNLVMHMCSIFAPIISTQKINNAVLNQVSRELETETDNLNCRWICWSSHVQCQTKVCSSLYLNLHVFFSPSDVSWWGSL